MFFFTNVCVCHGLPFPGLLPRHAQTCPQALLILLSQLYEYSAVHGSENGPPGEPRFLLACRQQ